MSTNWYSICCPEKKETLASEVEFHGGYDYSYPSVHLLVDVLVRPGCVPSVGCNWRDTNIWKYKINDAQRRLSKLEELPNEILEKIFENFSQRDLARLGLTTFSFALVVEKVLWKNIASRFGSWIGKKLFAVDANTLYERDVPNLDREEWNEDKIRLMERWKKENDGVTVSLADVAAFCYRLGGFPNANERHFEHPLEDYEAEMCNQTIYKPGKRRTNSKAAVQVWLDYSVCAPVRVKRSFFFPQDEPYFLLNFTTKEYVRGEAIAMSPHLINGPHITPIGFAHLILSKICYKGDPRNMQMENGLGIVSKSFLQLRSNTGRDANKG